MKSANLPTIFTSWLGLALLAASSAMSLAHASKAAFKPGLPWPDTDGVHINAHGFCIVPHAGKFYWYGSHKIAGLSESQKNEAGVRCYVSSDLLNWINAGLVLDVSAPGMASKQIDCN